MLAQFRQGQGSMGQNAIDFYLDDDGKIIKHSWAMGGSSKSVVSSVPKSIDGYIKLKEQKITTHKVEYLTDIDHKQIKAGDTIEVEIDYDRNSMELPSQYEVSHFKYGENKGLLCKPSTKAHSVDLASLLPPRQRQVSPTLENTGYATHCQMGTLKEGSLFFSVDSNTVVTDPSVIELSRPHNETKDFWTKSGVTQYAQPLKSQKDKFIANFCSNSGISESSFHIDYVALRCRCGKIRCTGWAVVNNNALSIKIHNELYS